MIDGWAKEATRGSAVVVGGFCELGDDGKLFNSAAVVDRNGVVAVYRKLHLWNEESLWFAPGSDPAPVVDTSHGRIGVGCLLRHRIPGVTSGLALAGAELHRASHELAPGALGGAGGTDAAADRQDHRIPQPCVRCRLRPRRPRARTRLPGRQRDRRSAGRLGVSSRKTWRRCTNPPGGLRSGGGARQAHRTA